MDPLYNSPTTPFTSTLADPLQRFLAAFIDGLVGYVPLLVFGIISAKLLSVGYLIYIAYFLTRDALPFLDGQSIGKKVMKIKAVKEPGGQALTNDYAASAIRQVSLLIPIFGIVDALMVVINADHKRFGDKWANTNVVKV